MTHDKAEYARRVVGLVSDTHGLARPQALARLRGSDLIAHAGDVGSADVLVAFDAVAKVVAVRGNMDPARLGRPLPFTAELEVGGLLVLVIHDLAKLDLDPAGAGFAAVVHGHTHRPKVERRGGVLYVNPGFAGPKRGDTPPSVGRLVVAAGRVEAEIMVLAGADS
ncbi:MAG: metallophosphoesterase family protein [Deltaproteobacteria bacterium]|nr:metallophosphoesterase family protein [Deltaproteobacteria bacterium]